MDWLVMDLFIIWQSSEAANKETINKVICLVGTWFPRPIERQFACFLASYVASGMIREQDTLDIDDDVKAKISFDACLRK